MKVSQLLESEWENVPEPEDLHRVEKMERLETRSKALHQQWKLMFHQVHKWLNNGILVTSRGDEGGTWFHISFPAGYGEKLWYTSGLFYHIPGTGDFPDKIRMMSHLEKFQDRMYKISNLSIQLDREYTKLEGEGGGV